MQKNGSSLLVVAALVVVLAAAPATAAVWHLEPDGSGDAPTIQAAVDLAAAGDTIELGCGTYYEHDIRVPVALTLCSVETQAACATIDAQQQGRILASANLAGALVCRGLTFTNGHVGEDWMDGGAITCDGNALILEACDFVGNYASYAGGAVNVARGQATITDCRFEANEGENGGGGAIRFTEADGAIRHCRFVGNRGIDGAGLFLSASSPTIEWCVFLNNDGWFFGGALFCQADASPALDHCTLVGNEAYLGSGIMTCARARPTLTNSVVAFNVGGPALHCDDGVSSPSYLDLSCSDVFGNDRGNYSGWLQDQTGLNGNISADPLFCDAAGGDLGLRAGSPCLPDENTCAQLMGVLGEGCAATTAVEPLPSAYAPLAVRPNPFNPRTTLTFSLPAAGQVQLVIYDARGGEVVRLLDATLAAGAHAIAWEGRDAGGASLPSGTYLCRLTTPAGDETSKLQLVR